MDVSRAEPPPWPEQELLEKLAALVPPPRLNLVRYHGVLAPNASDRSQIVPEPQKETGQPTPCSHDGGTAPALRRHRLAWAVLLARVFRMDVTLCPACGGSMKIVAALTNPHSILHHLLAGCRSACPSPALGAWLTHRCICFAIRYRIADLLDTTDPNHNAGRN